MPILALYNNMMASASYDDLVKRYSFEYILSNLTILDHVFKKKPFTLNDVKNITSLVIGAKFLYELVASGIITYGKGFFKLKPRFRLRQLVTAFKELFKTFKLRVFTKSQVRKFCRYVTDTVLIILAFVGLIEYYNRGAYYIVSRRLARKYLSDTNALYKEGLVEEAEKRLNRYAG